MLKLQEIDKIYGQGDIQVNALKKVSFNVDQGEFVAIMGQSGSGKSTLMNIIGCLDRPTNGIYEIDEANVANLKEDDLAQIRNKKIGFVFQSFNLLPRVTALQNVELPLVYSHVPQAERRKRAMSALSRVGLAERTHHRPNELSGGQKQRVAIARALVSNPTVILADEPTGNLDTATTKEIMNLFCELNDEGVTIIIVTHEDDVAEYTKRVVTLRDGEIISNKQINEAERRWAK
ncbi:ABC transporter ATP-binding protein [Clostridium sp. 'deep sea']|uniref:ABC transporter ATP-binding protein n=1 Tax=Clostridium sp. 'deep sea' TaxID=2779445 RepID=UPI001896519F|nr:ABC transporter ATP-binding protein [Clostridium sp. 'deep sea']QOR36618.1 ABC transporter ATP-binding protein [Clostridium sp. 'deep sea']